MTAVRRRGARARSASAVTPPRPAAPRTWPRIAAIVVVLAAGAAAAWGADQDAQRNAERREALVAEQTASVFTATVRRLEAALSGVSGLPDATGAVDEAAFEAYALTATSEAPFEALAYAPMVSAGGRAAFERALGGPITDAPGGPPAAERAGYLPVRWVSPELNEIDELLGFDLATDPVRRAAAEQARDTGVTVVSRTVPAQPSGAPAVFLVHPVYLPGSHAAGPGASESARRRAVAGYVTTAVLGEALLDAVDSEVSGALGLRVQDMSAPGTAHPVLTESDPPPRGGTTVQRTAGGREWLITVDDRQPVASAAPAGIAAGTLALAVALALLARRALRHRRDVERHVAMLERIAALGRALAATGSVEELARVVSNEVPPVLGARRARLGGLARDELALDTGGPDGPGWGAGSAAGDAPGPSDPGPDAALSPDGTPRPAREGGAVRHPLTTAGGEDGAWIEVQWGPGNRPDELAGAGLATVTEMCSQTLRRARLADRARRDAVSSRLLAGLAEAAATAGTTDQLARSLIERAAMVTGAETTHIGLASGDGASLTVVHEGQVGAYPTRADTRAVDHRWPLADAYHQARPVLLADLDAVGRSYPELVAGLRGAGLSAVACLPLRAEDTHPFGAVSFGWAEPQRFDPELLAVLRTTADVCAASLDRTRGTDRQQARFSALATLAAHLSGSSSFDEVAGTILRHATAALDADAVLVGVTDRDHLRLQVPAGPPLDVLARYRVTDLDGEFAPLLALRTRDVVTFPRLGDVPDRALAIDLARAGMRALACAPMLDSDGTPTGVVIALWAQAPEFDDALHARLATVADLCAQSVERSQVSDADHQVRRDLQHRVLPRVPAVGGLDVATRYRPAAPSVGMGGDWYDALALDGGRLCLVVGDVTGHGVGAVAAMTQVRTVVHTLVAGGMPLPDVLVRTSAAMQRDALGYATVVIAVVDPAAGSVSYVTAGHPPPLVRRAGGTVDVLTGGRHSLLGIDLVARPPGTVAFPTGATLVAYTDGLVERRDTAIDAAIAALADQIRAGSGEPADVLADRLLAQRPMRGAPHDDVALVVVHREG